MEISVLGRRGSGSGRLRRRLESTHVSINLECQANDCTTQQTGCTNFNILGAILSNLFLRSSFL